jgi:hypothetical protein
MKREEKIELKEEQKCLKIIFRKQKIFRDNENCILIERETEYVQIINERIEKEKKKIGAV